MSTLSRSERERRRDQAQRERANMAQIANDHKEGFGLFSQARNVVGPPEPPAQEVNLDEAIEQVFGPWSAVLWESGNPVSVRRNDNDERSPAHPVQPSASGSSSSQHGKAEHRHPAQSASDHSEHSRDRFYNHSARSHSRNRNEQRNDATYKNHSYDHTRSSSSSVPRSSSSHQQRPQWHSSHSRNSVASSSQNSSSNKKLSPAVPQHARGTAAPGRGSSPERDHQHHTKELTGSAKHGSDHQNSHVSNERQSRIDTSRSRVRGPSTPPCSPPPAHTGQWTPSPIPTPPSAGRSLPSSHRTPPAPPHRTPPPVRSASPHSLHGPPRSVSGHRTPPPSRSAAVQNEGRGQVDNRPNLTLNIRRENKSGELDDIFKEMAVTTPLTALSETPVKCKFQFAPRLEVQMAEDLPEKPPSDDLQIKPLLSPLPEPDDVTMKEASAAPPDPLLSSLSADLEVSDDSDVEMEEKEEENRDKTPERIAVSNEDHNSSSDSSSSSASNTDSSSDDSDEENEMEEDTKEEVAAAPEQSKPNPVASNSHDAKTSESWGLEKFFTKTFPTSAPPAQPSSGQSASKAGGTQDVSRLKSSPRKMAEIGPCSSMPFIVHDDSDPLPRNCEKSYTSPDSLSTPSSHTSSLDTTRGSHSATARRESATDSSAANGKPVGVTKPEVARVCEQAKSASTSNTKTECEGASASRPVADSVCASEASNRQSKHRRTSSGASAVRASRTSSVAKSPSVMGSSATVPPEGQPAPGKREAAEQQAAGSAGDPAASQPSPSVHNSKNRVSSKAKTPNQDSHQSTQGATKSATKKNWSKDGEGNHKPDSHNKVTTDSLTDIGSIIKDTSLPQLLSPTIPAYGAEVCKDEAEPKGLAAPTQTCGKPSILVRLESSLVPRTPQPVRYAGRRKQGHGVRKPNSGALPCAAGPASSEGRGDESKRSESACVKSVSGKTGGDDKKRNSDSAGLSPSPPAKRKKKADTDDVGGSRHQKVQSRVCNKSPPETNGVAHPEEVKKAGVKRGAERRGSAGSNSSRSSLQSSAKNTSVTKAAPASKKARKADTDHGVDEEKVANGVEEKAVVKKDLPFNSYKQPDLSPKPASTPTLPPPSQPVDNDIDEPLAAAMDRLESQDFYMVRAKELKHIADKKPHKHSRLVPYIRSVLYFIMSGHSYEKQAPSAGDTQHAYTIYKDTLSLHNYINHIRLGIQDGAPTEKDRKLSVLILRIQSILCLKLYSFRNKEVMKLKKILDSDPGKASAMKMSGHAPSPHQNQWNKNSTGTPSPMSPTPSPACSIGSVESQGSCEQPGNKMANGSLNNGAMSSPGTISVSQRIHSVTQKYVSHTANLVQCHESWDAANAEMSTHHLQDFFQSLDRRCGSLSINSSLPHLVVYVHTALKDLNTTTPS